MDIFDIMISEKLESIKAETNEKDWERFNKKFQGNKKPFLKVLSQNMYKIAATIGITSLLFFASAQYFTIKDLKTELEKTKIETAKLFTQNHEYLIRISELEEEKTSFIPEKINLLKNKKSDRIENNVGKEVKVNVKEIKPSKNSSKKKTKTKFFVRLKQAISNIFSPKKDSVKKANKPINKVKN